MATDELKRELGARDLILFYVVSSLSLRWIATAAASGQSAVSIWLLAWCGLFLPLAGSVLELSSRYPQEGGLYVWTREAFGEFPGFMAGWAYWMSNLPYFSAVLYFAASSLLFVSPAAQALAGSRAYFTAFAAGMLALITLLNVLGLNIGKWLNNAGGVGMMAPVFLLIVLGGVAYVRFGSATHFTWHAMLPHTSTKNLIFWSTIFFAFGGCEAGSLMGEEIKDARRTIPRALLIAGVIVTLGYIAGTVAMLVALPSSRIGGLAGFMTTIDYLCRKVHLTAMIAPLAVLVAVSQVGAAGAYLTATARLPFVAGIDAYLPPVFARVHPRWKTPYVALIFYGLAGVLFCLFGQMGTSVKGAYDMLVSMSIVTFFIPYLFLFSAMIRLQDKPLPPGAMRLPGGRRLAIPLASVGLFSTVATILLSLLPAEDERHPAIAAIKILGMTLLLLAAGAAIYWNATRRAQRGKAGSA